MKNYLKTLCLAILVMGASYSSATSSDDLATYANAFARAMKRYERVSFTSEARTYHNSMFDDSDGRIPTDRLVKTRTVDYWRDGSKVRMITRQTDRAMNRGKVGESTRSTEWVVTPENVLTVPLDASSKQLALRGNNIIANISINEDKLRDAVRNIASEPGSLFIFEGVIDYLGPKLSDQVVASNAKMSTVQVDGRAGIRLDFEDDWGIHSIWLDATRDFLPVRMTQHKEPRHVMRPGFRLGQVTDQHGTRIARDMEILVTGMRQVQSMWFVESFEVKTVEKTDKGRMGDTRVVVKVRDLSRDPMARGNTFTVQTPLQNGTRVVVPDQRPVTYEWRDGKVVKSNNQARAASLGSQQFRRSSRWWAYPTVMIGLGVGGYVTFKWRRRSLAL